MALVIVCWYLVFGSGYYCVLELVFGSGDYVWDLVFGSGYYCVLG